jgi:hypothetical protein
MAEAINKQVNESKPPSKQQQVEGQEKDGQDKNHNA